MKIAVTASILIHFALMGTSLMPGFFQTGERMTLHMEVQKEEQVSLAILDKRIEKSVPLKNIVVESAAKKQESQLISRAPEAVSPPKPVYPSESRRKYEEGEVQIEVTIAPNGEVSCWKLLRSSGFERLDRAAIQALDQALFRPGYERGKPVESNKIYSFKFNLDGSIR